MVAIVLGATASAGSATPAAAAPVPDRVLAEVERPIDIGVDGNVVAWTHRPTSSAEIELVIHDGRRVVRRLAAGRLDEADLSVAPVDIGRDARGRRVVVYTRCGAGVYCDVRSVLASGGPSRRVARILGLPTDIAIAGGRVLWTDPDSDTAAPRNIRSRALSGGAIRVAVRSADGLLGSIGAGARGIAATWVRSVAGEGSNADPSNTHFLAIARTGSTRLRNLSRSTDSLLFQDPIPTATGVTMLVGTGGLTSDGFADVTGGRRVRRSTGMPILRWDASGDRAAFIEGATRRGCEVKLKSIFTGDITEGEREELERRATVPATCRIVTTERARGERLLPPAIIIRRRVATITRAVLSGGRVVRQVPQRRPGVTVTVRDLDARTVATLKTDAAGRVSLPPATTQRPNAVIAASSPTSYAIDSGK